MNIVGTIATTGSPWSANKSLDFVASKVSPDSSSIAQVQQKQLNQIYSNAGQNLDQLAQQANQDIGNANQQIDQILSMVDSDWSKNINAPLLQMNQGSNYPMWIDNSQPFLSNQQAIESSNPATSFNVNQNFNYTGNHQTDGLVNDQLFC